MRDLSEVDGLKLCLDIILRDFSQDMGTPTRISAENDAYRITYDVMKRCSNESIDSLLVDK